MKELDELGISPWPWDFQPNHPDGCRVATSYNCNLSTAEPANARLIASAPELYECLRIAYLHMIGEYAYNGCEAKLFKEALEKASGEEVAK